MSTPLDWPYFSLPADAWEPAETDIDDPDSRLNAVIYINGHPLHLEAWALTDIDDIQESMTPYPEDLDHLSAIAGEGRFMTTTINDREYVLVAYSFCT